MREIKSISEIIRELLSIRDQRDLAHVTIDRLITNANHLITRVGLRAHGRNNGNTVHYPRPDRT